MFPSVLTLVSLIVAPQNSTMYCVYLLIFFPQGWFVGFCPEWLWMWAATLLNNQIRRTVLRNRKPWHFFNVRSLLFYIQFLNPITILLYTIKIYIYILNILLFFIWLATTYKNVCVRNSHQHCTDKNIWHIQNNVEPAISDHFSTHESKTFISVTLGHCLQRTNYSDELFKIAIN